jgi:hypothetical protein
VKYSSLIKRLAYSFTLARNCCATSEVSNRSRFFENTAWFHTASSIPRPTNQRNKRL